MLASLPYSTVEACKFKLAFTLLWDANAAGHKKKEAYTQKKVQTDLF